MYFTNTCVKIAATNKLLQDRGFYIQRSVSQQDSDTVIWAGIGRSPWAGQESDHNGLKVHPLQQLLPAKHHSGIKHLVMTAPQIGT